LPNLTKESDFIRRAAEAAGQILASRYGTITSWKEKSGRRDIVTAADLASEKLVCNMLDSEFPTHNMLTEEHGWVHRDPAQPTWVLDPLDGTLNFALGIPIFCVSLACLVDGKPALAAVYDPVHNQMYYAQRGEGAYLNGERIHVSDTPDLLDAIITVSWMPDRAGREQFVRIVERVNERTTYFRRIGSAATVLSYVAAGRCDGYIQAGINPWDVAAGVLLIQEAGGVVTDFHGQELDVLKPKIDMVAGTPGVHESLMTEVMQDNWDS